MFVTTADPILEPCIITMNTVLSLLAVHYPTNKLALYLSDDACSPLTYYSLVETTKFAKLWVPFCKKFNIQVRAPFRYFTSNSTVLEEESLEFKQEWKKYEGSRLKLFKRNMVIFTKREVETQRPFTCEHNSDFSVFCDVHRSDHPAIIKVISETTDLPHVIYISREKNPKHLHHYKAGAMNVWYLINGIAAIQGPFYGGTNCFHRRKVIYESAAQMLSGSNTKTENRKSPSSLIEDAIHVAGCSYEYGAYWGKKVTG
ncbi:hypothetical protein L1987_78456 [Smallanthus sonchifolius]|uniref:Uncharacterized protein n=1 Tax=Smallanthus sonchifolius TaxID=185202 RepID=A0ACB8ZBX1_9ASTR|nr:hypothetical protein L1987_78456 [Smallanthus sonchifolius]